MMLSNHGGIGSSNVLGIFTMRFATYMQIYSAMNATNTQDSLCDYSYAKG